MIAEDFEFVQQSETEYIEVLYMWNIGGIEVKGYNLNDKIVEVYFEYDGVKFLIRSQKRPTYSERFLDVIRALLIGNYSNDMATVIKVAKKVGKPILITSGIYKNSREFTVRLKFPVENGYSILFMEFDKVDLDTLYGVRFSYVIKDENAKIKRGNTDATRKVFAYMNELMFD
jgi:hypothetical protein